MFLIVSVDKTKKSKIIVKILFFFLFVEHWPENGQKKL